MLALLDADDKWHPHCRAAFEALHKPVGTTAAVLAELFHLARRSRTEAQTIWSLVRSDAVCVLPIVLHLECVADLPDEDRQTMLARRAPWHVRLGLELLYRLHDFRLRRSRSREKVRHSFVVHPGIPAPG